MWNITSNSVQQAKDRLQLRRTDIETRYAEDKKALDAEFAAIELLERAASEFMLRHSRENGAAASDSDPAPPTDPPSGVEQDSYGAILRNGLEPAAPLDPPTSDELGGSPDAFVPQPTAEIDSGSREAGGGLDILKPGSRWRLYRGNRPTDPEGVASDDTSTTG